MPQSPTRDRWPRGAALLSAVNETQLNARVKPLEDSVAAFKAGVVESLATRDEEILAGCDCDFAIVKEVSDMGMTTLIVGFAGSKG